MSPHPFASLDEMEKKLQGTGWRRNTDGGWSNKDEKEFGPGVYNTRGAYVAQLDKENKK